MIQITFEDAIAAGQSGMQASSARAESLGFSTEAAREFVLRYLREHGATPGEVLVETAERAGRPELWAKDGRAWGSVFKVLSQGHLIHCLRSDLPRKRGHGTSGGKLWKAMQ